VPLEQEIRFGPFTISPSRRSLTRDGRAVPLGSRAAEILIFLASHPGQLKTNAEIVAHVWPDTFVEEANLRVHISALRKALGDTQREPQFIANVPGRGYTFIGTASSPEESVSLGEVVPATPFPHAVPTTARIFGREQAVTTITAQLNRSRLLTIVGPGGIGKSAVARAVAAGGVAGEVAWVDLSEVSHPDLVGTVIASTLGVLSRTDDIVGDIASHLARHEVLLVLDNCEHVVDGVAGVVETILERASGARILATSREPIRAEGERVHRLPPLELPEIGAEASDAMLSPAVQLFVERADACLGSYKLTDADAPHVADICARLDGMALAIELAAGRLETISVKALAASLSDCFRVLTRGRRTALPRHRTLRATLDWSFAFLPEREQIALLELSAFRGWFEGAAAAAVLSAGDAEDDLASLVAKSLLVADAQSAGTRYRLLDTTRMYATEKLAEAGGMDAAFLRLASHLQTHLERAEQELYGAAISDWSEDFTAQVASLREALDWAFSDTGDQLLGVKLTVASLPLFFRLSLLDECLIAVTRAIAWLDARPGLDERSRMKLYAALGWPQMRSTDAPEYGIAVWSTALRIAEEIGDVDHQLRAVWALWVDAINRAEPRLGMDYAERFGALTPQSANPTDAIIGRRIRGATLHWLGRHAESRDALRGILREYAKLKATGHSVRFQFDQKVTARIILARVLWLLGDEEDALREVEETVAYATEIRHTLSLSNVLAEAACPLALLSGREDLAIRYIGLLRDHTKALSLDVWHCYADCFEAELMLRRGRAEDCVAQLRSAMTTLDGAGFTLFKTMFQSVEASALSQLGRHAEAFDVICEAIEHCTRSGERWCLAELYRVRGDVVLRRGSPDALQSAMEDLALAAVAADHDGAVAWRRRVTTDLDTIGHDRSHVGILDETAAGSA
jgi:predicted ATPase/DNA-binding winged helix-turn-helix (wHTH) protein